MLLESGVMGRAAVPSGASTGSREAIELRDGDAKRYCGKGRAARGRERQHRDLRGDHRTGRGRAAAYRPDADRARRHREQVTARAPTPSWRCRSRWPRRRRRSPGLPLYRYLGGAGAMQLPVPMMNVINGGAHANNSLDLQEFMIVPVGLPTLPRRVALRRRDVPRAEEADQGQRHVDHGRRRRRFRAAAWPSNEAALKLIMEAIDKAGYRPGTRLRSAWTAPARSSSTKATTRSTSRRPDAQCSRIRRLSRRLGREVSRSSASKTAWPRTIGTAGSSCTDRLGDNVQLVGDDRVRHQHQNPREGHQTTASPTRC